MKRLNLFLIVFAILPVVLMTGCGASKTAAHTSSSPESMVEQIAAQKEAEDKADAGEVAIGIGAETPLTTPPTAVAPDNAPQPDTGQTAPAPSSDGAHPTAHDDIDVDLTMLSPNMVYSEVYNILYDPLSYIGKTVQIRGEFSLYLNEIDNKQYTACIITDATACCANGFEFVRAGDYSFPEDYPEIGEEIIVKGVLEIYEENGLKYLHLNKAEMSLP